LLLLQLLIANLIQFTVLDHLIEPQHGLVRSNDWCGGSAGGIASEEVDGARCAGAQDEQREQ
jgi:hypothetical protein